MKIALRPYQEDALARSDAATARGIRRQLGVAATGLGKTIIFAAKAEANPGRSLILAHRDELISQTVAKILEVWSSDVSITPAVHAALVGLGRPDLVKDRLVLVDGADLGIVKAAADDVDARVVVASVQTLARPARLERLTLGRTFDLVVVDETHHATADSYQAIIDATRAGIKAGPCTCEDGTVERLEDGETYYDRCTRCAGQAVVDEDGPLLLGVTATPDRGDGKGLDETFDEIVFAYDLLWGIRAGYLSDVRGKQIGLAGLDVKSLKVRRGDYEAGAAGAALEEANAPEHIADAWQEHAADRQTLVFTPTVAVARLVAEEFDRRGVAAAWISGETPLDERRKILGQYAAGEIQVLSNCAVLTEGYDEPRTDCIVVARPTKSRQLYTQIVGRGTRLHPDKKDCLVLDVVGASSAHSLLTIPNLFGLEDDGVLREGGTVTEAIDRQEAEQVAAGALAARDADLFKQVRRNAVPWTKATDPRTRRRAYVKSLGSYQPTVVLLERADDDVWAVGIRYDDGSSRVLMDAVSLEMAQGIGEDVVRRKSTANLSNVNASWRSRKPTANQLEFAKKWKMHVDPEWTAGDVSDRLDAWIVVRKTRHGSLLNLEPLPTGG